MNAVHHPSSGVRRRTRWFAAAAAVGVVAAVAAVAAAGRASGAGPAAVTGVVKIGVQPLGGARVALFAGGANAPVRLGTARTTSDGSFRIRYLRPHAGGILYVTAAGGTTAAGRAVQLMTVAGTPQQPASSVTINELTTVGSVYALSRYVRGSGISGKSPGLANAAATATNLVDPATGAFGAVVATSPNGTDTSTLASLATLSDIVGGCTQGTARSCRLLLATARPPGGSRPATTPCRPCSTSRTTPPTTRAGSLRCRWRRPTDRA